MTVAAVSEMVSPCCDGPDNTNDLVRVKVQLAAVNGEARPHGAYSVFRGKTIRDSAIQFVREMDIERMVPANYQSIDLLVTCNAGLVRQLRVCPVLEYRIEGLRGEGSNNDVVGNDDDTEVIGDDEELLIKDAQADTEEWWHRQ